MLRKLGNEELGRMNADEFKASEKFPFILVLDNIRSMNNIGSMFRTADAFRIEELLLCGVTACPPHREIQRTALDATESVAWKYFENSLDAIQYLKNRNYLIYAVEQAAGAIPLQNMQPPAEAKIALIMGNEINGVSDELLECVDGCIEIPQYGTKHSFNVAVTAGITLWDLYTKTVLIKKAQ